jgi:hypothetical protein
MLDTDENLDREEAEDLSVRESHGWREVPGEMGGHWKHKVIPG